MTQATKTQTRGHCQCCGREQAVLANGRMSKHGYEVKNGWFNGVCGGQQHRAIEVDRTVADSIVVMVRVDCVNLRARAGRVERCEEDPATVRGSYCVTKRDYLTLPYAEGTAWQQRDARASLVHYLKSRADQGESFADGLERIANEYHGQALQVVTLADKPPAIMVGERRQGETRILICSSVDGARIYWHDGQGRKGWTGPQAWRRYALA